MDACHSLVCPLLLAWLACSCAANEARTVGQCQGPVSTRWSLGKSAHVTASSQVAPAQRRSLLPSQFNQDMRSW